VCRDCVPHPSRHRLLRHPGVRTEHPHRDDVVGLVLDQHRRRARTGLARPPHGAHAHDPEREHQSNYAEGVLHQGHRHLDDRLPHFRLQRPTRVCLRQRRRKERRTGEDAHRPPSSAFVRFRCR